MDSSRATAVDPRWSGLYRAGAIATLIVVALIPIAIVVFVVSPPPEVLTDWFALFESSWLLGLVNLDLLFMVSNVLLVLVYLALYTALRGDGESAMAIALALGLVGIAAYLASNTGFEMLALSRRYAVAATEAERAMLLGAGQAMLATFTGTAFNAYYVLNAIVLLVIASVMLRGHTFSRLTAYTGLASGVLMVIPASAGMVGVIFSLASLVPWVWFSLLIARRLLQLARPAVI